ncbi:type II and III secretion system protein family protein [Stenotrophomonas mori]|uniref:Type II and III secretion system protein family protein n=1 Tax=Stenotrophomonas mori TaxID=2871096 RepID=A0ABT0SE02_9GAMM|nr:type II and III secretion system protein family protein [Stenotrophomonas mori]MCL7713512.1 type II and III secretion system protein family protein [Stenotrophomonas mori]
MASTRPRPARPLARLLLIAAALALPAFPALAQAPATDTVRLELHEQRPWRLPADVERIAIADPAIADITTLRDRGQVLLVGKHAGNTTLLLWQRRQETPTRVQVEVRSAVQRGLLDAASPAVAVQDGQALLHGQASSLLAHEAARKAATVAAGDEERVSDASTIAGTGVVQVEVKVVEFNRSVLRQIGLNFKNANGGFSYGMSSPSSASDGGSALSSAFKLIASSATHRWDASLNLLQSNGMARVLAEPTLVALSGQSASFLAGGELPILEPQGLGTTTVKFKPFGIGLTVTPTVLAPDRIALKVAPEASDLDYTRGITLEGVQIPAITTRRADTTVELGDGESFVIGGLVSSQLTSMVNKIPLLGDIPIIGSFFRNLDYKREDKELVIVVTPRLVQPLARGTAIPLPGQREAEPNLPVWGAWLLHPASSDQLPGFSR